MADYWIAFRLKENLTYEERREALTSAIKASSSVYWDEAPSFCFIRSNTPIDELAGELGFAIDERTDLVLISEVAGGDSRYVGKPDDQDLFQFLPKLKSIRR